MELNHRVVARLKFLQQMKAHAHMLDFCVGQRVSFHPHGYPVLTGVITKYNRKTVSVMVDGGQQWNVSPNLLSKTESPLTPEVPTTLCFEPSEN